MFGLGLTFFGVLRTSLGLLRSFLCVLFALLPSRFHGAYLVLPTLIHRHHEIGEGVCALDLRHVELAASAVRTARSRLELVPTPEASMLC